MTAQRSGGGALTMSLLGPLELIRQVWEWVESCLYSLGGRSFLAMRAGLAHYEHCPIPYAHLPRFLARFRCL